MFKCLTMSRRSNNISLFVALMTRYPLIAQQIEHYRLIQAQINKVKKFEFRDKINLSLNKSNSIKWSESLISSSRQDPNLSIFFIFCTT